MKKDIKISIDNLATIIIVLYFMFFLINQVSSVSLNNIILIIGMSSYLLLVNQSNITIKKRYLLIILWFFVLFFLLMMSMVVVGNISSIYDLLSILQYFGIALLLINFKLNLRIIKISFYLNVIFFLYHILIQSNPNEILKASRNMISVIMIAQLSLLYIACQKNGKIFTYFPALLAFLISFWAIGRSGILTTGIIIIGVLIITLSQNKKKKVLIVNSIVIFIILISIMLPTVSNKIFSLFSENYQVIYQRTVTVGLQDDGRKTIIDNYLNDMFTNREYFLFGVPYKNNSVYQLFNNNLHNSYLKAHSIFGLFGIIFIFWKSIQSIINYFKERNFLYLILLIAILIRIATDTVAFFGILDPIIYYLFFSYYKEKNIYRESI